MLGHRDTCKTSAFKSSTETGQEERKREAKNDRKKRSWQSHEIKKETKLGYQSLTFEPQSLTICAAILTKHSKSTELRKLTKLLADLRTAMLLLYQGLKPQAAQVSVFELEELSFTCFASLAPCAHCTLLASVVASASQPTGLLQITDQLLLLCKLHNLRMLEERFPVTLHYQQMQTSATHLTMRTSFSKRQKWLFQQFLHLS